MPHTEKILPVIDSGFISSLHLDFPRNNLTGIDEIISTLPHSRILFAGAGGGAKSSRKPHNLRQGKWTEPIDATMSGLETSDSAPPANMSEWDVLIVGKTTSISGVRRDGTKTSERKKHKKKNFLQLALPFLFPD